MRAVSKYKAVLAGLLVSSALSFGAWAQTPPSQCVTNAVAGGTGDAITVPLLPCALSTNILILTITANNTTTTPTLKMGGFPALPILTNTLTAPGIGDFGNAGSVLMLTSTGTSWLIINGNVGGFIPLPLSVANGGTGDTTLTSHGVLYGNGTSAIGVTAAGTTGQFLTGNTGAAPTWGTGVASFSAGTTGLTPSSPTGGAVTLGGTLIPANGGTGLSSYTTGDLLYASSGTALATLADVATGSAVISGGVGVAPNWGKIGLTTHVSGVLPIANGGTGAGTFTAHGVLVGAGTSAFSALAPGTTGQILVGVTGADPVFTSVPASGVNTISFGSTGLTPASATGGVVNVAGTLAVASGGTGQTSYTDGQLLIGNTATGSLVKTTLTAGANIIITNGAGTVSIAAVSPGGGVSWGGAPKTTGFTFSANTAYCIDTTGGAFSGILPVAPIDGDQVRWIDCTSNFAVANFTVARNGKLIMGLAEDMTVAVPNAASTMVYSATLGDWRIW